MMFPSDPDFMNLFAEIVFEYLRGELKELERLKSMPISETTNLIMEKLNSVKMLKQE